MGLITVLVNNKIKLDSQKITPNLFHFVSTKQSEVCNKFIINYINKNDEMLLQTFSISFYIISCDETVDFLLRFFRSYIRTSKSFV